MNSIAAKQSAQLHIVEQAERRSAALYKIRVIIPCYLVESGFEHSDSVESHLASKIDLTFQFHLILSLVLIYGHKNNLFLEHFTD